MNISRSHVGTYVRHREGRAFKVLHVFTEPRTDCFRADPVDEHGEVDGNAVTLWAPDCYPTAFSIASIQAGTPTLLPAKASDDFQTIVTDANEDGSPAYTFEPWTDGHAVGFRVLRHADNAVSYVYLNPSTDTWSDGHFNPDVFVYTGTHGEPASDQPHHFYNIDFEEADRAEE